MREVMQSPVSLIHIGSALAALGVGTLVLFRPKKGQQHRTLGYWYVACMLVVLTTAFGIYRLFGRFSIVHWGAVASWCALAIGLIPVWFRRRIANWYSLHYFGMVVSISGLYATFIVEATYRFIPARFFWWSTVGTAIVVMLTGLWIAYERPFRRTAGSVSLAN